MFRAKFIGTNNSIDFKHETIYTINSQCVVDVIVVKTDDDKLSCPYSRIETFLENWAIL